MKIQLHPNPTLPWLERVLPQKLQGDVYVCGRNGIEIILDWAGNPISAYSAKEDGFLVTSSIVTWEGVWVRTELGLKRAVNKLLKLEAKHLQESSK